jgi:hypothetical protein
LRAAAPTKINATADKLHCIPAGLVYENFNIPGTAQTFFPTIYEYFSYFLLNFRGDERSIICSKYFNNLNRKVTT